MTGVVLDLLPSTLLITTATLPVSLVLLRHLLQLIQLTLPANLRKSNLLKLLNEPTGGGAAINEETGYNHSIRTWRSWSLTILASIEVMRWGVYGVIGLTQNKAGGESWREIGLISLIGLGWIYAAIVPLVARITTPPYLLFTFYLLHLSLSSIAFLGFFLHPPAHFVEQLSPLLVDFVVSFALVAVVLSFPMTSKIETNLILETTSTPEFALETKKEPIFDSPEDTVSLFSWITFAWVAPLIATRERLEYYNVWKLSPTMAAEGVRLSARETGLTNLISRIFHNNSLDIILSLSLGLTSSLLAYTSPYFLREILTALTDRNDQQERKSAYVYAVLALFAQCIRAEVDLQQLWHERRCIVRARSQLMGEVYEKALKRRDLSGSTNEKGASSGGKIVQLMSADAMRVANQLMTLSSFATAPVELIIAITFLYQLLGWTALAGLSVVGIALPMNHYLVKRRIVIHRSVLTSRDKRLDVLNEFVQSIRFVKYQGAEKSWLEKVHVAREIELDWLLKTRLNNLFINIIWNFTPDLISLVAFALYTKVLGRELDVATAFTALALFALARSPMNSLPAQITGLLQTYVSVQRLEQFFGESEVPAWVSSLRECDATVTNITAIEDGTFVYSPPPTPTSTTPTTPQVETVTAPVVEVEAPFQLSEINVEFPQGKLSLIVGPTASGKTTLCLALLGEMTCTSGVVHLSKDSVVDVSTGLYNGAAYAAQLPWLENATIRNNILFGSSFEQDRYDDVVRVCALTADLAMLSAGDDTEIGEKGINLSGGQKARISLARAVYSRAKTVLIDDALSALDMGTARHVYEKCLIGPLMKNRTVILCTHHVSLCLPGADYIVRLASGRITFQGQANEVNKDEIIPALDDTVVVTADADEKATIEGTIAASSEILVVPGSIAPTRAPSPLNVPVAKDDTKKRVDGKLVEEEARATGRVKTTVYKKYLAAAGWGMWIIIFLLILGGRFFRVLDRYWFKTWGESYRSSELIPSNLSSLFSIQSASQDYLTAIVSETMTIPSFPSLPSASDNVNPYLIIYALICVGNLVILVLTIVAGYSASFRASRLLFTSTLARIAHAPFRYWDQTPTGRILNRFSNDFQIVDTSLTDQVRVVLTQAFAFIVNVMVIVVVSPAFLPPAIIIIAIYVKLSASYIRSSRDLRRLESNARSPIYSKFGETLAGIITVRAFSAERKFLKILFGSVDLMMSSHYASAMINRYLLWRFDCLGAIAVFITTYLALYSGASPGLAALAITSAQALVSSVYWLCRWVSALEVDLNAVERITELLETPQERPMIEEKRPPANWPTDKGSIVVEDLTIAYSHDLPAVLKNLTFEVRPRESIGIVGRTGSGKSTLASALFRFVEFSSGRILIDGIDISTIGLEYRARLSLIAQDATLHVGTVRSNLDNFNEFTDADCLDALERVQLNVEEGADEARGRRGVGLDTLVAAGGHNFSAGQRQLLAMARALLKRSNIIIMDEATASVDFDTDAKIQSTIRQEFADSTVLTIAHRLRTIIDYDRILVLENGTLAEFDTPFNLLSRPDSIFRKMCENAADWKELKAAAGV